MNKDGEPSVYLFAEYTGDNAAGVGFKMEPVRSVFLALLCSLASAVAEIISYVKFLGFLKHSRDKA